jgi:GLPGLI family protein
MYGSNFNVEDSIPKLQWRITNENRIIAGFNCRKAVAIIFDSVYVFAFYTDEITIPGGPCSINGLPGMIMGVTIPRLYTSWIATKVMLNGVDQNSIRPVSVKKNYSRKDLESMITERLKDWYSDDADEKEQKARFIWTTLL